MKGKRSVKSAYSIGHKAYISLCSVKSFIYFSGFSRLWAIQRQVIFLEAALVSCLSVVMWVEKVNEKDQNMGRKSCFL